jgi:hypothetical protein
MDDGAAGLAAISREKGVGVVQAQSRLDELASEAWILEAYLMHLRSHYEEQTRLTTARLDGATATMEMDYATANTWLRQEVLMVERVTAIRLRD